MDMDSGVYGTGWIDTFGDDPSDNSIPVGDEEMDEDITDISDLLWMKKGVGLYDFLSDFESDGRLFLKNEGKYGDVFSKETVARREAYFIHTNGNCFRVDENYNLLDKDGNYIKTKDGNNIFSFGRNPYSDELYLMKRSRKDPVYSDLKVVENEGVPNSFVVSPYELAIDMEGKTDKLLKGISTFYKEESERYNLKIEEIDNRSEEIEKEINDLKRSIVGYDDKSQEEKVKIGSIDNIEKELTRLEGVMGNLEKEKKKYETLQKFTEAASENTKEVGEMYKYYNEIKKNEGISGVDRDKVKETLIETLEGLHGQARGFEIAVNFIVDANNGIDRDNPNLNNAEIAAIDCQLEIIKKRTELEQKNSQQVNMEQLRLWKDKFSSNEQVRNSVTSEREKALEDCRKSIDDNIGKNDKKEIDLINVYGEGNIAEIEKITNTVKTGKDDNDKDIYSDSGKKLSNYHKYSLSCYQGNPPSDEQDKDKDKDKVMSWSDVKDIKTFMEFIESQFSGDSKGAEEYYNNHKDQIDKNNNFIEKNGFDKIVKEAEGYKKAQKGVLEPNEKKRNPTTQAQDCIKSEMVNYLVGEGIDIETAKEMAKEAEFNKQPLKQYAKNLETIYTKKNKICLEGNTPLNLKMIGSALERGVEENSIGLKRRFITKKTKESARNINNLIMGAIVKECKGKSFDNLSNKERSEILNEALKNFDINNGITTNSLLASDSRTSALVMQGLKNINNLVEEAARDEEALKKCDEQIKTQIKNAENVIKEKGARCASKYYKNEVNKVEGFEEKNIEERNDFQKKSNDFKQKEGEFKKGIKKRVDNFLKPFLNTVDKDQMRRKNVTATTLEKNDTVKSLKFSEIEKYMKTGNKSLRQQLKNNRVKQQNNTRTIS